MPTILRMVQLGVPAALFGSLVLSCPASAQPPGGPGGPQPPFGPMGPPMGMQGGMGRGPMMPGMMPGPAPAIAAAGDYVYVLRGITLFQFAAKDMALVRRVDLEPQRPPMREDGRRGAMPEAPGAPPREPREPDAPGGPVGGPDPPMAQGPMWPGGTPQAPGFPQRPGMQMPMMGPAPVALTATAQNVYVLRGNVILQFSARDLRLVKRTPLPLERPRFDGPGRPGRPGGPDGERAPEGPPPGGPGPGEPG